MECLYSASNRITYNYASTCKAYVCKFTLTYYYKTHEFQARFLSHINHSYLLNGLLNIINNTLSYSIF